MIGCSSHRLNLAVKYTYREFSEEIELVNKLKKKLSTLKQSSIPHGKCNLRPVLKNETSWSSIFSMLTRYFELKPFIDTKDPELPPYVFTPQKENQIENYLEDLKNSESVSKKLQNENTTMENASILFSGLLSKFSSKCPNFTIYLQPDSNIALWSHFECGIVKV